MVPDYEIAVHLFLWHRKSTEVIWENLAGLVCNHLNLIKEWAHKAYRPGGN